MLFAIKYKHRRLETRAHAIFRNGQGLEIRRKPHLPGASDLAFDLIGYLQSEFVRPASRGHSTRYIPLLVRIIFPIESQLLRITLIAEDERKAPILVGSNVKLNNRVYIFPLAFPCAHET